MSIVDSVKRAPRWAWITAGGIGIGAAAVKLFKDRAADAPETVSGEVIDGKGVGTALTPPGSFPGVVVPPVVIGNPTPDQNQGTGVLQDLYVGAIADVVSGWGGLVSQLVGQQAETQNKMWDFMGGQQGIISGQIQSQQAMIIALAGAGAPPGQSIVNPSPVVTNTPIAPAPPAPAAPSVSTQLRTRDNGQSGAARRVWCNRLHIHTYPGRAPLVVSEEKVHDGAC